MAKSIPSQIEQERAINYVADTFENFKKLMKDRMTDNVEIYQEYATFKMKKKREYDTTFKVNKAFEVVNKILPRIMARNPKWLVSNKPDMVYSLDKLEDDAAKAKKIEELDMITMAMKDYLTYLFDKYNLTEPARIRAKNMLIYGSAFAEVDFAYEIARSVQEDVQEYEEMDEEGNSLGMKKEKVKKMKDYVWWEYPTINPLSFADLYYDPRYKLFRQQPGFIKFTNGIRLAQLKQSSQNYINIDKLEKLPSIDTFRKDPSWYKQQVFNVLGVNLPESKEGIDKNALSMKTFYGWYSKDDDSEESLYKISIVDDILVICFEEISQIPIEQIRCFEDTETNYATGFVEQIMGLQQELNFKKNSASNYINNSIYRSYFYSMNSGINPNDLLTKPNGLIVTNKDVKTAMEECVEVPHREINASYFQEQNDFERQIQSLTFTVDTSNPQNQQALTNTATGARIKFFESNAVIDEVRKHFESGLVAIAYKLLQATVDNVEDNIIIKKQGDEWFWEINKEAFADALRKYEIKIEAGSSSYDTIENRRDDALAQFDLGANAMKSGVPVNMTELFKYVLDQFENKDTNRFIMDPSMQMMQPGAMPPTWAPGQTQLPQRPPTDAAQLTETVAQWGITNWM